MSLNNNDAFLDCKKVLDAELHVEYRDQQERLNKLKDLEVGITTTTKDSKTYDLLENGTLPMPIKRPFDKLESVWHSKASYTADPSLEIEMLVGKFSEPPTFDLLGMHDGMEWIRYPKSTPEAIKL